ncbi:MAG: class I SAM-dependent methyltransferase [Candidatus Woesearchaeota archaeon]
MNKEEYYKNYISTHYKNVHGINLENERKYFTKKIEQAIPELKKISKKSKILDLGSGFGKFTYFCQKYNFKNYLGIDISKEEIELCKKDFKHYSFIEEDIIKFLKKTKEKYDLIFMSHVFEHFTKKEGDELINLVYKTLNKDGIFVNIMPNAHAYFGAIGTRYSDITHEVIYSPTSFSQMLKNNGFEKIQHKNYVIGDNLIIKLIHKTILKIFELFIQIMGYSKNKIYTSSMITIVKK